MKSFWNDAGRAATLERIQNVTPTSKARWGTMTAEAMLSHLAQTIRMATGELPTKSKNLPLRYFPLKQLVIYLLPFPKGAPTAPELLVTSPANVDATKIELRRLMAEVAAYKGPFAEHPAFGRLSRNQYGILMHRHFDHHLRQFGV